MVVMGPLISAAITYNIVFNIGSRTSVVTVTVHGLGFDHSVHNDHELSYVILCVIYFPEHHS